MRFKLWSRDTKATPQPGQPPPGVIPDPPRPLSVFPELDNGVSASILKTLPPEKDIASETALQPADNVESGPAFEATRDISPPKTRSRLSSFASPSFDMVSGRTPLGAWHAVAAKVVAANRFRGIGGSLQVEDFKIEELGGKSGHLVFGPVSVFNGNVTLGIKKPMKGMTLTITFTGTAEVDKYLITFIEISHELYTGDLQEGFRTFLFGFNFPYLNLPPTSSGPLINYSFLAKLSNTGASADNGPSIGTRISEFKSKRLEIVFIPYVDPALEFPPFSRFASKKPDGKERGPKGKTSETGQTTPGGGGEAPANGAAGPSAIPKPKLTLTTADLPSTASSNSTPIIDKPRPLDTSVTKTATIKDDDNFTLARLKVVLAKTKFLPGDNISLTLQLAVREGSAMPKGYGVRVVERRCLARADSENSEKENGVASDDDDDDEDGLPKLNAVGRERSRVFIGKKFVTPLETKTIGSSDISTPDTVKPSKEDTEADSESDIHLKGGKMVEVPVEIRLPSFKEFIDNTLLPTATLPLGPSANVHSKGLPRISNIDGDPDLSSNKGKSPMHSSAATSPTTSDSVPLIPSTQGLNFVVAHILQVTVPINGSWFKKPTSSSRDLEIAIPIVLGNINPQALNKVRVPEFRLNTLEERRYGFAGSSRSSRKSSVGSSSGHGGNGSSKQPAWREGERFLTLKETEIRPSFVKDF